MTKSTPSTTTQTNTNQLGLAQQPYLTDLWGAAEGMSGINSTAPGQNFLDQIQGFTQGNFTAAAPLAAGLVPAANNFVGGILSGSYPQYMMPAGPQIGGIMNQANNALNTTGQAASTLSSAAMGAPSVSAPYSTGLTNIASQFQPVANAGWGQMDYLNNLSSGAAGAGYGALSSLSGLAPSAMTAANPATRGLYGSAGMAVTGNPIYDSLMGMAGGQYVDPSTNPALPGMIQAATQPLVNQYETAVAPQTDSTFELGGRYGSGADVNAQGQNQYALGQGLGTATSSIINNAYNTGLNAMLGAGQAIGSAYNTGIGNINQALSQAGGLAQSGVNLAGNLLSSGYGALNSAYNTAGNIGNAAGTTLSNLATTGLGGAASALNQGGALDLNALNAQLSGLNNAGNLNNAAYSTLNSMYTNAGNLANTGALNLGGIAQMAPDLANFPTSQLSTAFNSMWAPLQNFAGLVGQPIGGNTTQTSTTPYYSNPVNNILGTALGAAQLAKMIP